ncbi:lysozyme-like [Belonocnema kinseyi]|uniref:lysozyme-like n=1 Tax=Belonocnema kinseyi TaxID=2817044 RepID=UPI00143D2321|nr:lysozyme-like [Belonocnema kinseyi]
MKMETTRFVTVFLCLIAVYVYGQTDPSAPVSQTCLGCICEASSGCNVTLGCNSDVCGPFRITWAYWADGGKPTLDGPSDPKNAYANCVSDAFCSAKAVQGYMAKYGNQDCNGDGKIDCFDYAKIHRNGGFACNAPLDPVYENPLKLCISTFGDN